MQRAPTGGSLSCKNQDKIQHTSYIPTTPMFRDLHERVARTAGCSRNCGGLLQNSAFRTWQGPCTHTLTKASIACTKQPHYQVSQNPLMGEVGINETLHIAQEILEIDDCCEREVDFPQGCSVCFPSSSL